MVLLIFQKFGVEKTEQQVGGPGPLWMRTFTSTSQRDTRITWVSGP